MERLVSLFVHVSDISVQYRSAESQLPITDGTIHICKKQRNRKRRNDYHSL